MVRLNRIVPIVVFVMSSSAVIYSDHLGGESSSAAVDPSSSSSSSHRSDTDAVQRRLDDGLIRSTWRLLASAVSGQVIGLRHTARQHLDDDDDDDDDVNSPSVISALRHRSTDEGDDGIRPTDRSRTDGVDDKDESTGTWRSDDRTDEGTKYEEQQQQQQQLRGEQRLPQAIIIGVKKGGTRALLEFLRTHPDVRAPGPEIHFFDKNYYRGLGWYRRQMPVTLPGQITVEKTPSYWITREVPARLFNMSRDVRLVVVVRDPATRALSDYAQAMTKRPDVGSFERLAFLRRRDATAAAAVDTSWGAIRIGMYARHLERWLEHFPRRSMHFVNGERLIADPAGELAGVQDFLRLKRIITDKHFFFNATKGFPCLKKSEGSGNPRCLGKTKGRPHPPVDEQVLRRLRDFYRPFNEKFYQMTGIDFNWP